MKTPLLKHFICLQLAVLIVIVARAQENEPKISLRITEEVNGEKKVFEGEYSSEEEMEADPAYQDFMRSHQISGQAGSDSSHTFFFRFDNDEEGFRMAFPSDEEIEVHLKKLGERMAELGLEMEHQLSKNSFRYHHYFDEEEADRFAKDREEVDSGSANSLEITELDGEEFGKKGQVKESERLTLPDLSYYPNPSKGRFNLRFHVPENDKLVITVYTIDGQEIYTRYFQRFSGQFSESVDLSGQEEGIYLLEIQSGQKRLTRKVIIH